MMIKRWRTNQEGCVRKNQPRIASPFKKLEIVVVGHDMNVLMTL